MATTTTIKAGESAKTITLHEGKALTLTGSTGASGVVYQLDLVLGGTNSVKSWAVGAGPLPQIGPFAGVQMFQLNCSVGSIDATVGDASLYKPSRRPKSNVITECINGFLAAPVAVGSANPYSVMLQAVAPTDWDSVQIGVMNASASAVVGLKVAFGAGTTLGAGNGTLGLVAGQPIGGLNFVAATWSGAYAGGTIPAAGSASTGGSGGNIGGSDCGIGWTDPINNPSLGRVDGTSGLPAYNVILTYPINVERTFIQMDGTTSIGWENEGSDTVAPFNRPHRVMVAATKDAVALPPWMMISNNACARSYTEFPPILVRFTMRSGLGETLVIYADSIGGGTGATIQNCGWPREFQARISTKVNPVAICCLAVAGSGFNDFNRRAKATFASFSQVSVYYPSLTPNSLSTPITAVSMQINRGSFSALRATVEKPGVLHFTSTCPPTDYSVKPYGPSDVTYRVAWNDEKRAGNFLLADFDKALAGPIDVNGQYTLPDSEDKIHPTSVGYYKMGVGTFLPLWLSA